MRADVKLGLAASVLVVLFCGWYFLDQDASQSTIPILDGDSSVATFQPEAREHDIAMPDESQPLDTLAAKPEQDTTLPDPPPVAKDDAKPSGLADLFRAERDADPPADEPIPDPPSEEPIAVATFAPPKPTPADDAVRMETHTVKAGDTMVEIARRFYGDARYLKPLIAANAQIADVTALSVGDVINLPDIDPISLPPAAKKQPTLPNPGTHTVTVGDTLYSIALSRLGEASRWNEIYELNKDAIGEDAGNLKIGQILKIPVR